MARIKRGVHGIKHRRKVMKLIKGFRAARRRNYRVANEALLHSLAYSYRDRRVRKRDFRSLQKFCRDSAPSVLRIDKDRRNSVRVLANDRTDNMAVAYRDHGCIRKGPGAGVHILMPQPEIHRKFRP